MSSNISAQRNQSLWGAAIRMSFFLKLPSNVYLIIGGGVCVGKPKIIYEQSDLDFKESLNFYKCMSKLISFEVGVLRVPT